MVGGGRAVYMKMISCLRELYLSTHGYTSCYQSREYSLRETSKTGLLRLDNGRDATDRSWTPITIIPKQSHHISSLAP